MSAIATTTTSATARRIATLVAIAVAALLALATPAIATTNEERQGARLLAAFRPAGPPARR